MPAPQGMESGPPLFNQQQMQQIYRDQTKRYIDSTFTETTIDSEEAPKKY